MNDINTPKDAICFLLCGACVLAIAAMVLFPMETATALRDALAPIGGVVVGWLL